MLDGFAMAAQPRAKLRTFPLNQVGDDTVIEQIGPGW
jgi:hypothetical protein